MTASFESRRYLAAALLLVSALPSAQAYCYYDDDGYEHCSMASGTRIAIGVIIAIVFALIALSMMYMRRRRVQRQNLTYITQPAQSQAPPAYPPAGAPFVDGGVAPYYNNYGQSYPAPTYPPPAHDGWNPQAGFAPPYQPPKYSPPMGAPPFSETAKEPV